MSSARCLPVGLEGGPQVQIVASNINLLTFNLGVEGSSPSGLTKLYSAGVHWGSKHDRDEPDFQTAGTMVEAPDTLASTRLWSASRRRSYVRRELVELRCVTPFIPPRVACCGGLASFVVAAASVDLLRYTHAFSGIPEC